MMFSCENRNLRQQVLRLAHQQPSTRSSLLPLLRRANVGVAVLTEESRLGKTIIEKLAVHLNSLYGIQDPRTHNLLVTAAVHFIATDYKKAFAAFSSVVPHLQRHFRGLRRDWVSSPITAQIQGHTPLPQTPNKEAQLGANVVHMLGNFLERHRLIDSYRNHYNDIYPEAEIAAFAKEHVESDFGEDLLITHWAPVLQAVRKQLGTTR